jgi:hypothetical protein
VLDALKLAPNDAELLTCLAVVLMYGGADPREAWGELTRRVRDGGVRAAMVEMAAGQLALKFDPALAVDHCARGDAGGAEHARALDQSGRGHDRLWRPRWERWRSCANYWLRPPRIRRFWPCTPRPAA